MKWPFMFLIAVLLTIFISCNQNTSKIGSKTKILEMDYTKDSSIVNSEVDYNGQISNGVKKDQYVFEILNLRTKNKFEYLKEIKIILAQIEKMEILTFSHDNGFKEMVFQFKGLITTREYGEFDFWFELRVDEIDARIIGSVG